MTLAQLLQYLDENAPFDYLDGDARQTLEKSTSGQHRDPIIGEIIKAIVENCGCTAPDCALERVRVVNALGPTRLKYMADDAPVEGFRAVEGTIHAIDGAFNEEALRQKQS